MPFDRPALFLAAHPDDEVLGAGGQLFRDPPALVVHVTDGAPRDMADARAHGFRTREAYAEARRLESEEALAVAGLGPERIVSLRLGDQEAALGLAALADRLARFFQTVRPVVVFTHAFEGGHPDHDAVAFATHAACALLKRVGGEDAAPPLFEFTSYHAAPDGALRTGVFLAPNRAAFPSSAPDGDVAVELSSVVRNLKRRMLNAFRTQAPVIASFATEVERFRRAPAYRFLVTPHPPPLYYEGLGWGWTVGRWRALTAVALRELDLPEGDPL